MQLPIVSGYNLSREKMVFPRDFAGEYNLVFIPFQQWQQREVDSWVPFANAIAESNSEFTYYEFPTIRNMNFFARTFINEGMRAGIPDPHTRERTITLYLDKQRFRRSWILNTESAISVILFDRDGTNCGGQQEHTPQKKAAHCKWCCKISMN
jgi:hypothetical protein